MPVHLEPNLSNEAKKGVAKCKEAYYRLFRKASAVLHGMWGLVVTASTRFHYVLGEAAAGRGGACARMHDGFLRWQI